MLFRFYSQGKIIADRVTLPYTLSDLTPNTHYTGVYTYTALDDNGNELGIRQLPDFQTTNSGNDEHNTNDDNKQPEKQTHTVDNGAKADDVVVGD